MNLISKFMEALNFIRGPLDDYGLEPRVMAPQPSPTLLNVHRTLPRPDLVSGCPSPAEPLSGSSLPSAFMTFHAAFPPPGLSDELLPGFENDYQDQLLFEVTLDSTQMERIPTPASVILASQPQIDFYCLFVSWSFKDLSGQRESHLMPYPQCFTQSLAHSICSKKH